MATVQEIEDAIRRLAAKNPKDPNIGVLAKARADMLAQGGGASAPAAEPSMWQRVKDTMESAGQSLYEGGGNVKESLSNPAQSLPDMLRSLSNTVTFGGTDRLNAALWGRDYEQEKQWTRDADERLGSLDDTATLGLSLLQPSLASKYVATAATPLARVGQNALVHGAEGAGLSGVNAVVKGEDPLSAMAYGGFGGAGGSTGADVVGSVANTFSRKRPQFKTDEELFEAADAAKKSTKAGKDLKLRAENVENARLAQPKGQQGFKDLLASVEGYGAKESGLNRQMREQLTTLANKGRKGVKFVSGMGENIGGGSHWTGRLPFGVLTGGVAPVVGNTVKSLAGLADEVSPKQVEKYKALFRQGVPNDDMTPEMVDQLRSYLARMGATAGREP